MEVLALTLSSQPSLTVDAVVIGSGPGGYHAAIRLGQLGRKTALVEREKIGGVCLNVGCVPSKALITTSKLVKNLRDAQKMGIEAKLNTDLGKLQDWKQGVVNRLTVGVENLCKQNHVQIVKGTAKFLSTNELEVGSPEKTNFHISFSDAIIATGSSPVELPNVKFDGKRIITSTEALEFRTPPRKLLLIGGGVIGLEIGMAYANLFGTQLIIVEILDQLLPGTDIELVNLVSRNLDKLGAKINLKSKVRSVVASENGAEVEFETADNQIRKVSVDYVVVGVGRRPNTKDLGLENAGVQLNEKGFVKTDKQMRTNIANIFAVGDVVGAPLLAHKAMKEGIVAAEVICGEKSAADFQSMPAVIFTDPEIALVGLSPNDASLRGIKVMQGKFPYIASGRALAANEPEGFAKVLADAETGAVIGVEIVGYEASDLIGEACLAIEMGATLEDIGLTVHPHPTLSELVMEASENALGKAIHIPNRPQVKPQEKQS